MQTMLSNIPTKVITGFLGVGKTTAILNLLNSKPENETWAVLVNEFGKVGIDGQLLKQAGVEIKEVPGGCMCCAAGVSMQVGLNALIAKARPDRLLIEPTGIGHPKQIIKQLSQPPFDSVLDMRACICLVDPRHLSDERYMENEYYQEQLAAADVLVANKTDQASAEDKQAFEDLLISRNVAASSWVMQGQLDPELLDLVHGSRYSKSMLSIPPMIEANDEFEGLILAKGERFQRLENHNDEAHSCGWLFADDVIFDHDLLLRTLSQLNAERIKATLKTDKGNCSINSVGPDMGETENSGLISNRIEIIGFQPLDWQMIEIELLNCFANTNR